jgi:hypothetical protein
MGKPNPRVAPPVQGAGDLSRLGGDDGEGSEEIDPLAAAQAAVRSGAPAPSPTPRRPAEDFSDELQSNAEALNKLRSANAAAAADRPLTALGEKRPLPAPARAPTRTRAEASKQVHATQVFPNIFPYESPTTPGVWIDPKTDAPCAPRYRTGGQFSLRFLVITNTLNKKKREVALPMATQEGSWPLKPHETAEAFEIIFDFEDDRDLVAKMWGVGRVDPLKRNEIGGDGTIPGLLNPTS